MFGSGYVLPPKSMSFQCQWQKEYKKSNPTLATMKHHHMATNIIPCQQVEQFVGVRMCVVFTKKDFVISSDHTFNNAFKTKLQISIWGELCREDQKFSFKLNVS